MAKKNKSTVGSNTLFMDSRRSVDSNPLYVDGKHKRISSALCKDDYELPNSGRKPDVDPNFTDRKFHDQNEDQRPTLPVSSPEEIRRGKLGNIMNTIMDERSFYDGVLLFARIATEGELLDPTKRGDVKDAVYRHAGRNYFDVNGELVSRDAASSREISTAFRDDYQRIFPKGREGRKYNQPVLG